MDGAPSQRPRPRGTPVPLAIALVAVALVLVLGRAKRPDPAPPEESPEANELSARVQSYLTATESLRKAAKKEVPTGRKPEEQAKAMELRKAALAREVRALRANAKAGEFFTVPVAAYVKRRLKAALEGPGAGAVRDGLEEQNDPDIYKGPVARPRVNESLEAPLLPAALMGDVPALPDELTYRFAGRTLVLEDADAGLVLDFVADALPEPAAPAPPSKGAGETATRTLTFLRMPRKVRSVRFAVLGDTGTGDANQRKVADMLWSYYAQDNRFKFVLLLGDNLYASRETAEDYRRAFTVPYQRFLDARVVFHATLGNHDRPQQADFPPFHMGGKERYAFTEHNVKFVCLNSNKPSDPEQLKWLDQELSGSSGWRICFFHHTLYSSGQHGAEAREIRGALEDALVRNQVQVVFSGHEHFYERATPQKGVQYFVSGAAAKLRRGDLRPGPWTAFGWDREHSVMIVEIAGDTLFFQALGVTSRTIDCGVLYRTPEDSKKGSKDASTQEWLRECGQARAWAAAEGSRETARTSSP